MACSNLKARDAMPAFRSLGTAVSVDGARVELRFQIGRERVYKVSLSPRDAWKTGVTMVRAAEGLQGPGEVLAFSVGECNPVT